MSVLRRLRRASIARRHGGSGVRAAYHLEREIEKQRREFERSESQVLADRLARAAELAELEQAIEARA